MWGIFAILLVVLSLQPASAEQEKEDQADATAGPVVTLKADLAGAKNQVQIVRLKTGDLAFLVKKNGPDNDQVMTPEEFAELYYNQRAGLGWWGAFFNITSPIGFLWIALGFAGQLIFAGRMIVQWLTSEKHRQSIIPVSFWWMSLIGASMLLVYFIWRRDIVGIFGQSMGWVIYLRNLMLIRKSHHA